VLRQGDLFLSDADKKRSSEGSEEKGGVLVDYPETISDIPLPLLPSLPMD
jgi:hypothetical protein